MQNELTTTWEFITPELAAHYLTNNNNRKMREALYMRYAADMSRGKWLQNHQGIAFNCDGSLRDGQHRLKAIVISGCPQYFLVTRNLPDESVMVIDNHSGRNDADALTLSGFPVDKDQVAVARQMFYGPKAGSKGAKHLSRTLLAAFLKQHFEAVVFVCKGGARKGVSAAPMRAAIARAFYHCDHETLSRFHALVRNGVDDDYDNKRESAAIKLREWILGDSRPTHGGSQVRAEVYQKTQSALLAFVEGRPLTKLYAKADDAFPLPTGE